VPGRFRAQHREDRLEQREVDHLPGTAAQLHLAQRRHHRERTLDAGDHVGQRERRQHRLAVGEAVAVGEAGHRLDQGAEAGAVAVRAGLAEAGDAHHDERGVGLEQHLRREAHRLQGAGAVILDQHLRAAHQPEQQLASARLAQVERHAPLVAGVDLPRHGHPLRAPVAQRIALARRLDLDHVGAVVGELQAQHVAGHQPRQVQHPQPVERPAVRRVELLAVQRRSSPGDGFFHGPSQGRSGNGSVMPSRSGTWNRFSVSDTRQ